MLWYIYLFHGNKTRPASSSYEMLTGSVIIDSAQTADHHILQTKVMLFVSNNK